MPLESCMILLDNSQYMRNGDYLPSRISAQQDAANLLVSHKTQSNPESTVGVIAMNGGCYTSGVELLVSPTDDVGKILGALHGIPLRGEGELESGVDVPASVQVASLALKHRRNKNGQQRIVMFVGSPLSNVDKKTMIKAGKTLKKNNVKIDVVAMGEWEENEEKLKALVDAANGSSSEEKTCHLVTIPAGTLPSDILIGSPVIHGEHPVGAMGNMVSSSAGTGGGNDFAEYGGVDPNLDPELAMALRISMEEERARQERIARENQQQQAAQLEETGQTQENDVQMDDPTLGNEDSGNVANAAAASAEDDNMVDEDAMLQQALAMSMANAQPKDDDLNMPREALVKQDDDKHGADDEDEDVAMQMALAMSMAEADHDTSRGQDPQQFQDPEFVNQLLGSLPGIDPNDPAIRSALQHLEKSNQEDESEEQDKSGRGDGEAESDDKK